MGGFRFNFSGVLSAGSRKSIFWLGSHRLNPRTIRTTHTAHMDDTLAEPARRRHVKGRTGATSRREHTRRAPAKGWYTCRRPPPLLPVLKEQEKKAYIRSLKEAPSAVVNAKNEKDRISAENHEDNSIMEMVAERIDELKGTFAEFDADEAQARLGGIPPDFYWSVLAAVLFQEMKGCTILRMQFYRGNLEFVMKKENGTFCILQEEMDHWCAAQSVF